MSDAVDDASVEDFFDRCRVEYCDLMSEGQFSPADVRKDADECKAAAASFEAIGLPDLAERCIARADAARQALRDRQEVSSERWYIQSAEMAAIKRGEGRKT